LLLDKNKMKMTPDLIDAMRAVAIECAAGAEGVRTHMVTQRISVSDMQCVGCAGRVRAALLDTKGVVKVITSLDDHSAEVTFDEKSVSVSALESILRDAGFLLPEGKCC
jgi:copper chaperone CopZ